MTPKLSILIPTTPDRAGYLKSLFDTFHSLLGNHENYYQVWPTGEDDVITVWQFPNVEIITYEDNYKYSVGYKRNKCQDQATGDYVASIDSDDQIKHGYFKNIFEGIKKGVDCCSLKGIITENGTNPLFFEHSIKYKIYRTITDSQEGQVRYERYPNHLNCIKSSIAKQFRFPEINHGEDTDWATQIHNIGLIKTEHYIEEVIYHYDWRAKK